MIGMLFIIATGALIDFAILRIGPCARFEPGFGSRFTVNVDVSFLYAFEHLRINGIWNL